MGASIPSTFSAPGIAQLVNDKLLLIPSNAAYVLSNTAIQTSSINAAGVYFPVKVTSHTQVTMVSRFAQMQQESVKVNQSSNAVSISFINAIGIFVLAALIQLFY